MTIEESVLNHAVMSAIHKIARNEGDFVGAFRENVIRIIGNYGQAEEKDEYEDKIKEKQQEMVDLIAENAKIGAYSEAFDRRYQTIADEIKNLKERQIEIRRRKQFTKDHAQRIQDMDTFLRNNTHELQEFDDDLVRRLVENVKILSADKLQIQFKSGICMEQEMGDS